MKIVRYVMIIGLGTLMACGPDEDTIRFDGEVFSSRLKSERGDRAAFTVTSRPVSSSPEGAREAARYEAISYCVNEYGSSAIAWVVGPDSEADQISVVNDTLTFAGRCPE